jgi:hypothetical protein
MSDIPKIVHDRLRASVPGDAHPDADVLTAFAEQALSGTEREDVVRHLSRCGDCREVIALSIPPMETAAAPKVAPERIPAAARLASFRWRAWFAWPNLRWAAMAAAIVVVASVLVLRPGNQHKSMVDAVNRQAEQFASSADANATPASPAANQAAPPTTTSLAKSDKSRARQEQVSRMIPPQPSRARTPAATDSVSHLADDKRADLLERKGNFSSAAGKLTAPATSVGIANGGIAASENTEKMIGSSRETVEVEGAAEMVQPVPMEDGLTARNDAAPAIVKAKPAAKEEAQLKSQVQESAAQNKLAAAYSNSDTAFALQKQQARQSKDVTAQWSLAQGKLQRSVDAGATWQIALQLEHRLLSFGARGGDIWAGGQAGTLFHSDDSGTTWSMVQPSTKSGSLSSDIVAIEIHSPAEIVLSTNNNESWTTFDAGKTWEKK